jgi:hypothetical protein
MHSPRLYVAGVLLLLALGLVKSLRAQDAAPATSQAPAQPQQPVQPQQPNAPPSGAGVNPGAQAAGSSSSQGKPTHAHDFLIRGTVFQPNSLAFPAVRLRIRRAKEKKFRWDTYTNSRGEFAVRVPQGLQYELVIHQKGFVDQVRTVDGTSGISEDNVVFRMQAAAGGKK